MGMKLFECEIKHNGRWEKGLPGDKDPSKNFFDFFVVSFRVFGCILYMYMIE